MWERRIGDEDFGQVRIGLGPQQLATPLVAPDTAPVDELEPLTAGAMQQFLATHGTLDGLPMAVSLRAFYHMTVSGEPESVRGTARALVGQLAALHSPEDLVVAVVAAGGSRRPSGSGRSGCRTRRRRARPDGAGSGACSATDSAELEELLAEPPGGPPAVPPGRRTAAARPAARRRRARRWSRAARLRCSPAPEGLQGVTVIEVVPGELDEPRGGLSVVVHPERTATGVGARPGVRRHARTCCRRGRRGARPPARAAARGTGGDDDEPLLANLDFTDLLNLGDAASVDVAPHLAARVPRRSGCGCRSASARTAAPVMLDLKEAAQEGMGPHGLCVGATGSGKSELLRTLVLGLAVTHSSETLNFVLADFKGGATFAGMSQMPHVAAVITNLADDLTLVDRMGDSIRGELQPPPGAAARRGQLRQHPRLREGARGRRPAGAACPSLVLVIDEFSELLTAKPDFIEMFIQIGRIGRSLGVHLLLASQRLEEGRLRGLETYLSYRIGLRTFSAAESRAAIGVPDAYHLPTVPGSGYLKFGTDEMVRFKAAYVSGRVPLARTTHRSWPARPLPVDRRPVLFTAAAVPVPYADARPRGADRPDGASSGRTTRSPTRCWT